MDVTLWSGAVKRWFTLIEEQALMETLLYSVAQLYTVNYIN